MSKKGKVNLELLKVPGSSYELSLKELTGQKIEDVYFYVTEEFGFPVLKITRIIFTDGTSVYVEGEHDCPYISHTDEVPGLSYDNIANVYDAEHPESPLYREHHEKAEKSTEDNAEDNEDEN